MTGIVYALPRSSSGRGRSVLATLWGRAVAPFRRLLDKTNDATSVLCKWDHTDRAADDGADDFEV